MRRDDLCAHCYGFRLEIRQDGSSCVLRELENAASALHQINVHATWPLSEVIISRVSLFAVYFSAGRDGRCSLWLISLGAPLLTFLHIYRKSQLFRPFITVPIHALYYPVSYSAW